MKTLWSLGLFSSSIIIIPNSAPFGVTSTALKK